MIPSKVSIPQKRIETKFFFNYVISIPNAFNLFQLQIVKFLRHNTKMFVHVEIYHDKALYNKENMACTGVRVQDGGLEISYFYQIVKK